jgi:polyisoprenyl-teichoic acid--peptidoglycan teichoic acid transferase
MSDGREGGARVDGSPARGATPRALRRRRKRTAVVAVAGVMLALAGGVAGFALWSGGRDARSPSSAALPAIDDSSAVSTLLVGTGSAAGARDRVVWMTLLSYDPARPRGSVVSIPVHTAVEVPGRGLQGVGGAYSTGGMPLLVVSTENLLDVDIDHFVELTEDDALLLLDRLGPLDVDVPSDVRVAAGASLTRLVVGEGLQRLPPAYLERLLFVEGFDEDDTDLGSRHLVFWDALFDAYRDRPAALAAAIGRADGALEDSNTSEGHIARILTSLAVLPDSQRTFGVLPVTQVSAGGQELYELDGGRAAEFLSLAVGGAGAPEDRERVQVLNGNGEPGIGQEVGRKLVRSGFRIVLSGNAPRLDYDRTLIITYDSSPEGLEVAREARRLLGVGQVQVSSQPQGIVNLTVVVGKDFLRRG